MSPREQTPAQVVANDQTPQAPVEPIDHTLTPSPRKIRRSKMLAGIGVVLLGLAALVYFLPNILGILTDDIPPIDDSDLIPAVRNVPLEENGWRFMAELQTELDRTRLMDERVDELLKDPDDAKMRDILEKNARALELFQAIADAPAYQEPQLSDPAGYTYDVSLITGLGGVRELTRLSLIDAYMHVAAGRASSAVAAIIRPLRVARHLTEPNTTYLSVLVSLAIQGMVLEQVDMWLQQGLLGIEIQSMLAREISFVQNSSLRAEMASAWQGEYMVVRNAFRAVEGEQTHELDGDMLCAFFPEERACLDDNFRAYNYYLRPNETLLLYANFLRGIIHNLETTCDREIDDKRVDQIWYPTAWRMYVTENAFGRILANELVSGIDSSAAHDRFCEMESKYTKVLGSLQYRN